MLFYRQHITEKSACRAGDARNLIDQFIIGHLVLGIGRSVRAQKHAHDVVSVSFDYALLD